MRQPLSDYDEHDDDGFGLVGEERLGPEPRPERRLPAIALSGLLMVVFAGGLWFLYHHGSATHSTTTTGEGGVPLIRADQQPTKVKPEQPGGMQIPDQNVSIYSEKPGVPKVEKLLPPPEKPIPRPAAPPPPPPVAAAAAPPVPASTAPAAAPPSPAATQSSAPAVPPRQASEPPPHREAGAGAATPHVPAGEGPLRLQVAAVRTPEAARTEWARLKREFPDLLGKLSARAVRADLGDKGIFYRIQAGQFADAGAAERLCSELKRHKLGCTLVR